MMRRNTILLQIFVVSFIIPFAHSSTSVIKHEQATWFQASDSCGNDGLEFKESILNEVGILHGKMFWFGKAIYRKTSDWIEILGCYNVTDADADTMRTFRGVLSVAECQIRCWSISFTNFGYKMTKYSCVCSKNIPLAKTNMQACESKTYLNSYFFYQVYMGQVADVEGGRCTSLQCISGLNHLKAVNCKETMAAAWCGSREFGHVVWGKTFSNSLHWCISKNQLLLAPLNYCKIDGHQQEGILSWTNVFRGVWDRPLTKVEGRDDHPLQCLAGQQVQVDGLLKLIKTEKECNEVLDWFICNSETQTKHTDLNTLASLLPPTKTDIITSYITAESISNTMYMYSSETPSVTGSSEHTNDQRDPYKKRNDSETIGAVIGGILGACSMIAVVSVLIVCKLRSKGIFTGSTHVYEDTGQVICSKTIYEDINNTTNGNTTTASTQTCDFGQSSSPVYDNINESK